jgi:hypothetical protein
MRHLFTILLCLAAIQIFAQEKIGINTSTPEVLLDARSTNDTNGASIIQMATPSKSNWLTFFAGHQTDPRPFMYFSNLDTMRIATGLADYNEFTEHLIMLPDGKIGINMQTGAYTSIADIFQVFADDTMEVSTTLVVNDIIDLPATIDATTSYAQSFEVVVDGDLNSFNFSARCPSGGSGTLLYSIRAGSANGTVLASGNVNVNGSSYSSWDVNSLGLPVVNGTIYYLRLDYASGDNVEWGYSVNNFYLEGDSFSNIEGPWSIFSDSDFACAFLFLSSKVTNVPIFTVENEARVKVHDYRLPAIDGSPGQVMTTDGSGELSWATASGGGSGGAFINLANVIRHAGNQSTDDFIFGDTTLINPTQNSFFFDKSKGAFRTGYPDFASIPANIGDFSFASGSNVRASGTGSIAAGKDLVSSGDYAAAFGQGNKSSGTNSIAAGLGSNSLGINSFAIGDATLGSARNATAMGQMTKATNMNAISAGELTTASGRNSLAMGYETQAIASHATAFGLNTQSNSIASFSVGMNNHPVITLPSDDIQGNYPLFMVGNGETNSVEDWSNAMTVLFNGNTGLGLNDPKTTLHINDFSPHITLEASGGISTVQFTDDNNPSDIDDWRLYSSFLSSGSFRLEQDGNKRFIINGSGEMSIGDVDPVSGYRLAVDGGIIAEEVRVQLKADWPDYVFSDHYNLWSLENTEEFIFKNHHLPNIPDAETVNNEGIELGEMQKRMMEKIEELTLHIIDLNKRIKQLESLNNASK